MLSRKAACWIDFNLPFCTWRTGQSLFVLFIFYCPRLSSLPVHSCFLFGFTCTGYCPCCARVSVYVGLTASKTTSKAQRVPTCTICTRYSHRGAGTASLYRARPPARKQGIPRRQNPAKRRRWPRPFFPVLALLVMLLPCTPTRSTNLSLSKTAAMNNPPLIPFANCNYRKTVSTPISHGCKHICLMPTIRPVFSSLLSF